jgi:hypothetical protein
MDIENLIKDTFTAHEHDAPDGAPVLAGARRRIERGRVLRSGPLAVAAGVVVLAVAAVTVVALSRPADQNQVDAAGGGQAPAPASNAQAKTAITGVAMPFSLGWLPSGQVDYTARRLNIAGTGQRAEKPLYEGEYLLTVKQGNAVVLLVDVEDTKMMSADDATFKSGPGRPVTIGGQSGVESSHSGGPGGYELYLNRGDGSTYVNVAAQSGTASAQQLIDTGRRVARHIEFPGSTSVMPAFGLRDLPSDKQVCAFDIGDHADPPAHGVSTSYDLGTCTTMPSIQVTNNSAYEASGVPGHPVQGHKTRYAEQDGILWVLDAVHGDPIAISGESSQTVLYDIANHLVLPN